MFMKDLNSIKQNLIQDYINGISITELSEKYKVSKNSILENLRTWNITQHNPKKSLIKDFDKDIIKPWKEGKSLRYLADIYHTSRTTLSEKLKNLGYNIKNKQIESRISETIFDSIDTEEKAYWLGFIYADGNIKTITKKIQTYTLNITLKNSDIEHLHKFNIFMSGTVNIRQNTNSCVWAASNKHLWQTLNKYGCTPNKSLTLKFPDENIFKSKDLIRHFIRGYFDGDGCISYNKYKYGIVPRCSVLGTLQLVTKIAEYSNQNNGLIQLCHTAHDYYNLKLKKSESIEFLHYLYDNCSIYLTRKYLRYKAFVNNHYEIPYNSTDINIFNII